MTRLYIVTLFNFYAEYIMWNEELDEAQAEIKIARRNINNLRYADDTILMMESEEELKNLLMRVKEENKKAGLKLNSQKMKIMAPGPITSWQIDGEKVAAVTDFIFLGSKITAVTAAMKLRYLLLGRKTITNLDSILKSKDITLQAKVHIVKTMVFPAVRHGCESWTIKKAKCWKTDAFELWCWRRLESFLYSKEIKPVNPEGNQPWILNAGLFYSFQVLCGSFHSRNTWSSIQRNFLFFFDIFLLIIIFALFMRFLFIKYWTSGMIF